MPRALKVLVNAVVAQLEAQKDLPDAVPEAAAPKAVANPFG